MRGRGGEVRGGGRGRGGEVKGGGIEIPTQVLSLRAAHCIYTNKPFMTRSHAHTHHLSDK